VYAVDAKSDIVSTGVHACSGTTLGILCFRGSQVKLRPRDGFAEAQFLPRYPSSVGSGLENFLAVRVPAVAACSGTVNRGMDASKVAQDVIEARPERCRRGGIRGQDLIDVELCNSSSSAERIARILRAVARFTADLTHPLLTNHALMLTVPLA
jgi:hypothetical protein